MRWLVLWLLANLIFCLDNLTELVGFLLAPALIASRHSFAAGRQQLTFILLPRIECLLLFLVRERVILDNVRRLVEVGLGICNLVFQVFRHPLPLAVAR